MSKETLQALASEPLPPYEGIDIGAWQDPMYADNGPVVSNEEDPGTSEAATHPFQGSVPDDTHITIGAGQIYSLVGAGPASYEFHDFGGGTIAVSGNGTVYLYVSGTLETTGFDSAVVTYPVTVTIDPTPTSATATIPDSTLTIQTSRFNPGSGSLSLGPVPGTSDWWDTGGGSYDQAIYVPIVDFETDGGGNLSITKQYITADIFIQENVCAIVAT